MTPPSEHTHICAACHQPFECDGEYVAREDEDGFMIPRCTRFHIAQDELCDACRQADEQEA